MAKNLASFISVVFHPVFVFLYLTLGILLLHKEILIIHSSTKIWILIIILTTVSVLIPVGIIYFLQKDLIIPEKGKRIIPILIMSVIYFCIFYLFKWLSVPGILKHFVVGLAWGLIIIAIINFFFQISLHTSMMGAVIFFFFKLCLINCDFFFLPMLITILLAGLIGSSRLFLKAHSEKEVYFGYLAGIAILFLFL
jgi:hypothetical protein